jgi:hypothetical protein
MKKVALYSRSDRGRNAGRGCARRARPLRIAQSRTSRADRAAAPTRARACGRFVRRHQPALYLVAGGLFALALVLVHASLNPPPPH